jgi:hypothetical protein
VAVVAWGPSLAMAESGLSLAGLAEAADLEL